MERPVDITYIVQLVIAICAIAGMWKVFVKAGQPGWAAIVPIYNLYVMTQIAGKPGWWLLLFFIPFVNIVIAILLSIAIAQKFGKGAGFGVGMTFLGFIFMPILGFGDAQYDASA
ncbi:MAG TPA: signal peptidase I [Nannocystis exedens]|nr:signal peptidase I [Nannocystis exedens]